MPDSPDAQTYKKYQGVIDDYRAFVKKNQTEYPIWLPDLVSIYEDKSGRHAVQITVETGPRRYTDFYLMYVKSDKRTKVIKGATAIQFHM